MTEIVAGDIGGTHARFAIAEVADGRVVRLGTPVTLGTSDHHDLAAAWVAFGSEIGRNLPAAGAIAVAAPVYGEVVRLTNSDWRFKPAELGREIGPGRHLLINDFGAVAHAVHHAAPEHFQHLCGPDVPLPDRGSITICGPGTGLGVGQLLRAGDHYHVVEGEGGHVGFAPADAFEDELARRLRGRHGRVSAERVCSGPGIAAIYAGLAPDGVPLLNDRVIWTTALDGSDPLAVAAMERFCLALGTVAGDLVLAQGAKGVVIAGGLGLRLKDRLPRSGFAERFRAKGRFADMMANVPVKLISHPQPGLFGAAAAYAARFT